MKNHLHPFVLIQHLSVLNVFVLCTMASSCPIWIAMPSRFEHVCPLGNLGVFCTASSWHLHWLGFCRLHFLEFPLQIFLDLHRHFIWSRLAPSTAVATTRHYLLDCMVIFCTPFTFHFFRPSSLFDVCSPCNDELKNSSSFISRNCHPGHPWIEPMHVSIVGLKGIVSIDLLRSPDSILLVLTRQPRSLPSSLLYLDTWHPPVLGSSCQHGWTTQTL